jgi:arsenate reductase (thioredoxin)
MTKTKVLFVCVHNAGRSQMAEAWLKHLGGEQFDAQSAGLEPGTLNPLAVEAMKEIGIDISANLTKSVFDLYKQSQIFNVVVAVCDESSSERCPVFPGMVKRLHWSFEDPSSFQGSWEEKIAKTRVVRDQIKAKVGAWIQDLKTIN